MGGEELNFIKDGATIHKQLFLQTVKSKKTSIIPWDIYIKAKAQYLIRIPHLYLLQDPPSLINISQPINFPMSLRVYYSRWWCNILIETNKLH